VDSESVRGRLTEARAHHRAGRLSAAALIYDAILRIDPAQPDALHLLGLVELQSGRAQTARALIAKSVLLRPDYAPARNHLGNAVLALGDRAAALACYTDAIGLDPKYADAYFNRGNTLLDAQQHDAAIADYGRAIELDPQMAPAHLNLGIALAVLGRCEEALGRFDRAIALQPANPEAHYNRGLALQQAGKLTAAIESYGRAIELRSDYAEAYVNRGMARLLSGDLLDGWSDFEWRWAPSGSSLAATRRHYGEARWLGGEPLAGKTIFLHGEQGLGDTIQFCRYAALLANRGANVVMEVERPLLRLLHGLRGISTLVPTGDPPPRFDYQIPLMSLPLACQTDLRTIPAAPKYLAGDSHEIAHWRDRLSRSLEPNRPWIGLASSGNPTHANDANRSLPLAMLLDALPRSCGYVVVQKDIREQDRRTLAQRPQILEFSADLHDFSDTAALCEALDVVVSVDTSLAHLSAALGKPTWILLPNQPDWRWLVDRSDSPWYPTATLFRQERPGDWSGVLHRVRVALDHRIETRRPAFGADGGGPCDQGDNLS
jgi:lipoprotein NlpI